MESKRARLRLPAKSDAIEFALTIGVVLAVVAVIGPLVGLTLLVARAGEGALRVWAWITTLLVPLAGYAGWWARSLLARAETEGLGRGMEHTLDVVRAVRPAKETVRDTLVKGHAELPRPGTFEIVQRENRVIDL